MQDLEKRRPTKPNMSPKEWVAVNNLKKDKETIIIPADKGDKSILMDYLTEETEPNKEEDTSVIVENESYLSKLEDIIQEHIKIDEDPAKKHEKALNAAFMKMWKVGRQQQTEKNAEDIASLILNRQSLKD